MTSAVLAARPLVVFEGPAGCSQPELDRLRAEGIVVVPGFRPPIGGPRRVVCSGAVEDAAAAGQAILAVIAGAGIVVEARADRTTIDRLVDDLRRFGRVDHRVAGAPSPDSAAEMPREGRALLGLLAEGLSLGEAAIELGLARRTADRRLAATRRALGVERTTAAIAKARRLGWFRRSSGQIAEGRAGTDI